MATPSLLLRATTTNPSVPVESPTVPVAEKLEQDSSVALTVVLMLLIGSFWTSYYLKVRRITAVHETIVGLFAGMLVGAALRIGPGEQIQKMLTFSNTIMLNVLLPPIILASGYDLRQENFFRNFGVILTFAFAGTFISAIVIGVIVYLWSLLHLESLSLNLLECLIFGSTLSATDPVTILAIFNTYKVDPQLYSVVFGESLLNDAVSIVMFDVMSTFRGKPISIVSLFHGLGLFLFVFTFSMALGVIFGLGCSLMLKHSRLSTYPPLESALVLLVAYTSYFFSNGVESSGIVSLLFCGITLKHYAYHNMSRRTQRATRYTFQTLANLSENFIFIYLGLSLFTQDTLVYKPLFIIITVVAVIASRYCAVFPIASFINAVKRARMRRQRRSGSSQLRSSASGEEEISREYQIMIFWAGLRGAVGFALSANIEGQNASALQTTVLVAVVLTVIAFGGTTAQMLEVLGIRTGVQDDEGDSTDEEEEAELAELRIQHLRNKRRYTSQGASRKPSNGYNDTTALFDSEESHQPAPRRSTHRDAYAAETGYMDADDERDEDRSSSSTEVLPSRKAKSSASYARDGADPAEVAKAAQQDFGVAPEDETAVHRFLDRAGLAFRDGRWFSTLDRRYLTPLFTNSVASRKHEERKAMRRGLDSSLQSSPVNEHFPSGRSSRSRDEFGELGPLGPLTERDADTFDVDDEDGSTTYDSVRPLGSAPAVQQPFYLGSGGDSGSASSRSGGRTPVRRPGSRSDSYSDLNANGNTSASYDNGVASQSGPAGSRLSGAFAPGHASSSSMSASTRAWSDPKAN